MTEDTLKDFSFDELFKQMLQLIDERDSINKKEDSKAFREKKKQIEHIKKILIKKWAGFRPVN